MVGDITTALAASKDAVDKLMAVGERTGAAWTSSPVPGQWSPSQIVEHVARSLEESANMATGRPANFPKIPSLIHPVLRIVFRRILRKGALPKGRTTKAMDPLNGPATPADGRARLETAHREFDEACRLLAANGERLPTTIFGAVPVEDYVRFMELHTRHHGKQMANR